MSRRVLCLAAAILLAADAPLAQTTRALRGFERFQAWARLVHEHVPGADDDAARAIAAWPLGDLQYLLVDLTALKTLLAGAKGGMRFVRYLEPAVDGRRATGRWREVHLDEVPAMLALPDDGWSAALGKAGNSSGQAAPGGAGFDVAILRLERGVTHFVKLAAMMHADIAVLAPSRRDVVPINRDLPPPNPANRALTVVQVRDGQAVGLDDAPVHWELGRLTLDMVKPEPAGDEFVRHWYRATASYQLGRRSYGYATPHLTHARAVLPRDPYIQFYSGVMQENVAAPPVQVAVQSLEGSAGYRFNVLSVPEQLQQADAYLRRALELDANLHEARIRLARVAGLQGRHADAAAQLRRAMPLLEGDAVRYYAELFLGGEEQVLGRSDEARTAFERASALVPLAQSPFLALSQLAWQKADRAAAFTAFRELAMLPGLEAARQDPWWSYDVSPFADADTLLATLRAAALKEKGQ